MTAVTVWLADQPSWVLTVYAVLPAFSSYLCMYAFRKPYTALLYEDIPPVIGVDYKTLAVVLQLVGYATSKVLATKFSSEARFDERARNVLLLVAIAETSLLGFALVPPPFNLVFLFVNGLPLGMVWSMLFGLLEGRQITELLALSMASSQIFASGWAKAAGLWLLSATGCPPFWMPALTGLLFSPVLAASLWLLSLMPPPSAADRAARTPRQPMSAAERATFVRTHLLGIAPLCLVELCLLLYRDLRDTFMPDILGALGASADPATFASVDMLAGVVAISLLVLLSAVRSPWVAVHLQCACVSLGGIGCGMAGVLMHTGRISPVGFFVLTGVGLYATYTPLQSLLMDRLIAALRTPATAAFLSALVDSCGYVATVLMYLGRNLASACGAHVSYAGLLITLSWTNLFVAPLCMAWCLCYYRPFLHQAAAVAVEATDGGDAVQAGRSQTRDLKAALLG